MGLISLNRFIGTTKETFEASCLPLDFRRSRVQCPRRDLNPGPLPYQGSALPLSYKGMWKVGRVGFEPT